MQSEQATDDRPMEKFAELPELRIGAFSEQATIRAIGLQLRRELESLDDSFEYCSVSPEITHECPARLDQPIGRARWIACYAVTGGSEGHYVHVDRIYQAEQYARSFRQEGLFLIKTFGGYARACQIAAYVGARLGA